MYVSATAGMLISCDCVGNGCKSMGGFVVGEMCDSAAKFIDEIGVFSAVVVNEMTRA